MVSRPGLSQVVMWSNRKTMTKVRRVTFGREDIVTVVPDRARNIGLQGDAGSVSHLGPSRRLRPRPVSLRGNEGDEEAASDHGLTVRSAMRWRRPGARTGRGPARASTDYWEWYKLSSQ